MARLKTVIATIGSDLRGDFRRGIFAFVGVGLLAGTMMSMGDATSVRPPWYVILAWGIAGSAVAVCALVVYSVLLAALSHLLDPVFELLGRILVPVFRVLGQYIPFAAKPLGGLILLGLGLFLAGGVVGLLLIGWRAL